MYSIILSYSYHENSTILLKDNQIISGLEEERTSRNRHAIGEYSSTSIIRLLEQEKITIEDIDEIFIDVDNDLNDLETNVYLKLYLNMVFGKEYIKNIKKLPKLLRIKNLSHHDRHALSSFYTSGFKTACSICIDGEGDLNDSVTLSYIHEDGTIDIVKKFDSDCSLGVLYGLCSEHIIGSNSEGKFMGLASFGKPSNILPMYFSENGECIHNIENMNKLKIDGEFKLFNDIYFPFIAENKNIYSNIMYYANFAATIQECINVSLVNLAKYMKKLYPNESNLIISGGVALNCTANSVLDKSNIFNNIHCFPAANDAGTAWGVAYYYLKKYKNVTNFPKLHAPYYGPKYDCDSYLNNPFIRQNKYFKISNISTNEELVDYIINDKVIAWFQDGSECGPRALGHRSFLGDPREATNWKYISQYIKKREFYRPLAPIVLAEFYEEIFDDPHPDNLTEYMLKNVTIKKEWRNKIPAVCHIDNTARPQKLYRETNPELYDLIYCFYQKTGIPLLINTSFNAPGKPIIETLQEAMSYIKELLQKSDLKIKLIVNGKYMIVSKNM